MTPNPNPPIHGGHDDPGPEGEPVPTGTTVPDTAEAFEGDYEGTDKKNGNKDDEEPPFHMTFDLPLGDA